MTLQLELVVHRDGQELPPALGRDMVNLFEKQAQQSGVARPVPPPVPPPRPPPDSAPVGSSIGVSQPRPPPRPPGFRPGGGMGAGGGMNGLPMGDPNAIVFNEMGVPMGNLGSLGIGMMGQGGGGNGRMGGDGMGLGGMLMSGSGMMVQGAQQTSCFELHHFNFSSGVSALFCIFLAQICIE